MLVLSRKVGEKILIDDDVMVTVVKIEGNQVRLGIEAPAHVRIRRRELAPKWGHDDRSAPHPPLRPFSKTG